MNEVDNGGGKIKLK